jgi:LPS export ABC transporter protein LptC
MTGCVKPPDSSTSAEDKKIETPTAEVETEKIAMRKYDTKGKVVWEVRAAEATGELSPKGDFTDVRQVTAIIYDSGSPAFEISADRGNISKSTGKLDLEGDVTAKSADDHTSLSCDRITWNNELRNLHATGNVSGTSNGATLGPADSVTAKFKNIDKKMNTSTITALVLTSLIMQGPRIHYKDGAGNMDIGADKFSAVFDEGANLFRFSGSGSPIVAKWLKQGITVSGRTGEGAFSSVAVGGTTTYELQSAKFTGNITAKMDGAQGNVDIASVDVFTLDRAGTNRWKFAGSGGPFSVKLPESGATLTGSKFEGFAKEVNGKPEWEAATFSGGVKAVVTQLDKNTNKTYTITATCPKVVIDRDALTVTLSGGARAVGNHPAMGPGGAQIEAPTVILKFDPTMSRVVGVDLI